MVEEIPDFRANHPAMRAVRGAMRVLGRISPRAAGRVAYEFYYTPRSARVPAREMATLRMARRTSVPFEGAALAAYEWGSGDSTVLLMHGWEGRAGQLGAFVDPLVASGHRVVAIDGPAHGRSPGRRTDITQFAGALRATERKLGPIDGVIAHSLGATSVTVALRHGLGPRRLVYVAPMAFAEVPFRKFLSLVGIDARVETNLRARIERAYGTDVWTRYELANLVGNPQAALLVIHDEKDRDVSVEEGKALAAAWPRGEIVVTSGLGHRRILRDAEVVKRAVAFLQSR